LEVASSKDVFAAEGNQTTISQIHFLPDGQSLVTRGEDRFSREWEAASGKERRVVPLALDETAMAADISADGRRLAVGLAQNRVDICDATNGKKLHSINGDKTGFSALAFSPDGKVLAVREMLSPLIHIHDAATGKEIRRLEGPPMAAA